MSPLEKAIQAVGTPSEFARAIQEKPQTVNNWRRRGVPAEKCRAIEEATAGAVTAAELRPDVFGEPAQRASDDEAA